GTVHSVRTLALAFVLSLGLYYWYKYWVPDQDLPCEDRLEKLELEYEKELSETNSEHAIEIDECSTKLSGIRKLSEQGF
ncbi:MAG: hypothetical protein GWN86_26010, partial [Desulfobacterales bacterium]|nr:hypothetical protein [Desulfobacterales bacterium]